MDYGVVSALVEVECLRTLDRLLLSGTLSDEIQTFRATLYELLDTLEVVEISRTILTMASLPMPSPVGTLDAIHVATAVAWRDAHREHIVMATHDQALGRVSRAMGLGVVGA